MKADDEDTAIFRPACYREIRNLALSLAERGPTREAVRLALADALRDIDTNPAAFWRRDGSCGLF